ncbi:MAG: RNA-binding protein [Patescibacteria group bacterium]|nr:RNA-binding protein [Patescibacteria group bacterium]
MNKKLYVGNIDYNVTDGDLKELFSEVGTVESAQVISDRQSGRSRGFGFVEMSTEEEAKAAIEQLDGTEHDGRNIKVSEARPKRG